jgi:hypothetical protein
LDFCNQGCIFRMPRAAIVSACGGRARDAQDAFCLQSKRAGTAPRGREARDPPLGAVSETDVPIIGLPGVPRQNPDPVWHETRQTR